FNPRPAEWPGATIIIIIDIWIIDSFNPRPAEWPGATVQLQLHHTANKIVANARTHMHQLFRRAGILIS
ncbi:MAG: hypothetical protein R6W74_05600, partial [Nitrosomonas halophila]